MTWPDSRGKASRAHQFGHQPEMPLAALNTLPSSLPFSLNDSYVERRLAGPSDVTDEDVYQQGRASSGRGRRLQSSRLDSAT